MSEAQVNKVETALLIHGSLPSDEVFTLPENFEIVTFTKMGKTLYGPEVKLITDCFRNNSEYDQRLIGANWGLLDGLGVKLRGDFPECQDFEVMLYDSNTAGGCPNILLTFGDDRDLQTGSIFPAIGFFKPGEGNIVIDVNLENLGKNIAISAELDSFITFNYHRYKIDFFLKNLVYEYMKSALEGRKCRLFLFCCHGGSQPRTYMNVEREVSGRVTRDRGIIIDRLRGRGEFNFTNQTTLEDFENSMNLEGGRRARGRSRNKTRSKRRTVKRR